jgi:hypothetical protein
VVLAGLLTGIGGPGLFVGRAGADEEEPSRLTRCEADFVGFMVGSANDAIHQGCEDLAAAYQAGVAAYQQRNATCDLISRLAHPIKRLECEAGAKKDGLKAFRAVAKPIRAGTAAPSPTTTAAAPTATAGSTTGSTAAASSGDDGQSVFRSGIDAVTRTVENHPAAALGIGLGAASLAIPPVRVATFAAGRSIPAFLGKLFEAVKTPFVAAARALA